MTARAYMPEDFATVAEWAADRGYVLHEFLLSKTGFIAEEEGEPVLAVFCYQLFDVPVIQIDHLLGRPGQDQATMREAWGMLARCIKDWTQKANELHGTDYRIMRCFIDSRLGGWAEREGWEVLTKEVTHAIYVL
jgi:hypothetical protein